MDIAVSPVRRSIKFGNIQKLKAVEGILPGTNVFIRVFSSHSLTEMKDYELILYALINECTGSGMKVN